MRFRSKMMVSSSPGRSEKLVAPPFTRLLRGKGGSRSCRRSVSRSSPMFVIRRRNNVGTSSAAAELQDARDPGSPKVTCIGQVRIKKKNKKKVTSKNRPRLDSTRSSSSYTSTGNQESKVKKKKNKKEDRHFMCFRCFQANGLLYHPFSKMVKSRVWPIWQRWLSSSCSGSGPDGSKEEDARGGDLGNGSLDLGRFPRRRGWEEQVEVVKRVDVGVVEVKDEKEAFVPTEPPKNALLLMRCRSAPQRPAAVLVSAVDEKRLEDPTGDRNGEGREAPAGDKKLPQKNTTNSASKEEGSGSRDVSSREDDLATAAVGSPSQPLALTRCRSEPAKKAARLAVVEASSFHGGNAVKSSGNGSNKYESIP